MICQDGAELRLVLGAQQRFDSSLRESGESCISRGKNRERPAALTAATSVLNCPALTAVSTRSAAWLCAALTADARSIVPAIAARKIVLIYTNSCCVRDTWAGRPQRMIIEGKRRFTSTGSSVRDRSMQRSTTLEVYGRTRFREEYAAATDRVRCRRRSGASWCRRRSRVGDRRDRRAGTGRSPSARS